jgi:hypothetical protein
MSVGTRIVACPFQPRSRRRASRPPRQSDGVAPPAPVPLGRVPRVARLLALALRLEQLVQTGVIANYAELARLGHVSRKQPRSAAAAPSRSPARRGHTPGELQR